MFLFLFITILYKDSYLFLQIYAVFCFIIYEKWFYFSIDFHKIHLGKL